MNQAIKNLVENPHRVYKRHFRYWDFLLNSYEGGPDYTNAGLSDAVDPSIISKIKTFVNGKEIGTRTNLSGNLFKHKKERSEDFEKRIEQSYYYNFCAPIVDIYTNHLFKDAVDQDFGNITDIIEERGQDIDRQGSSILEIRKEIAVESQIYGHCYVIVDMPKDQGEITMADKIANGKFPYLNIFVPQSIVNWSLDEFGSPYWVLVREMRDSSFDPVVYNKDKTFYYQYKLWTREGWSLFDEEYNFIEEGIHGLGIVPIVCFYNKRSRKQKAFLGISEIQDIAFIARDVYNACSELKQILRDQTFAFLAVQGRATDYDEAVLGTTKGLVYPEGMNVPQYVSPPTSNADVYFGYIDRQVKKMFQMAKLEGGSGGDTGEDAVQQSGIAKAWDFNQTNSALNLKASNLNDGELKVWQAFAKWEGLDFDGSIQYPDEFSIQSVNQDLDEAEKMFKMNLGAEVEGAVKEAIIKKKFPRMPEDKIDEMIESMRTTPKTIEQNRINGRFGLFKQSAQ